MEKQNKKCRRCDIRVFDDHRASFVKHLRSNKHMENIKNEELIIPDCLFQETVENMLGKVYNPITLKQIERSSFETDYKQVNNDSAEKMLNPFYLTDRALQVGLNINLDSHQINSATSKITNKLNYSEIGIEIRYIKKILEEMDTICARLRYHYKFNYQTVLSAKFDKQDEDGQMLHESEFFFKPKYHL